MPTFLGIAALEPRRRFRCQSFARSCISPSGQLQLCMRGPRRRWPSPIDVTPITEITSVGLALNVAQLREIGDERLQITCTFDEPSRSHYSASPVTCARKFPNAGWSNNIAGAEINRAHVRGSAGHRRRRIVPPGMQLDCGLCTSNRWAIIAGHGCRVSLPAADGMTGQAERHSTSPMHKAAIWG